jgi:hypothetical protein
MLQQFLLSSWSTQTYPGIASGVGKCILKKRNSVFRLSYKYLYSLSGKNENTRTSRDMAMPESEGAT